MMTRTLIAIFMLSLTGSVLAADVPATTDRNTREWCKASKANREECRKRAREQERENRAEQNRADRRKAANEKCLADPAACETVRARRAADTGSTTPSTTPSATP